MTEDFIKRRLGSGFLIAPKYKLREVERAVDAVIESAPLPEDCEMLDWNSWCEFVFDGQELPETQCNIDCLEAILRKRGYIE